jgi:hypothetical protein
MALLEWAKTTWLTGLPSQDGPAHVGLSAQGRDKVDFSPTGAQCLVGKSGRPAARGRRTVGRQASPMVGTLIRGKRRREAHRGGWVMVKRSGGEGSFPAG